MDKQDFQEQDFMKILVRLPCCRASSLATPTRIAHYSCKESRLSLQG